MSIGPSFDERVGEFCVTSVEVDANKDRRRLGRLPCPPREASLFMSPSQILKPVSEKTIIMASSIQVLAVRSRGYYE